MTKRPLSDMKNVLPPALTMFRPWIGSTFSPSMLAFDSKSAVSDTDGEGGLVSAIECPVRTESSMMISSLDRMVFSLKVRSHCPIF